MEETNAKKSGGDVLVVEFENALEVLTLALDLSRILRPKATIHITNRDTQCRGSTVNMASSLIAFLSVTNV